MSERALDPDRYVEKILRARVYDVARETPLESAPKLSQRLGQRVLLKREDLQPIFSFKNRGAFNKMAQLPAAELAAGVIAASAGNHAQGVALGASRLGISASIVMPVTTPAIKVSAVRGLGAEVILHGDTYDEAAELAADKARSDGRSFIHPYDDPEVIAGQGTVAMEIFRQHPDRIDAVFVPVGGGGLIAGVASYAKFVRPETAVIGVEPEDAACLYAALRDGERTVLDRVGIFCDGAAVRQVGSEPFRLVQGRIDGVIRVDTDEICAAIQDIFEDTRSIAEPAGALAVAGMKKFLAEKAPNHGTYVAINSGANMSFHRLRHISERTELGEAILAVTIPERPGSFREFCDALGSLDVTEFNYRYTEGPEAQVFVGVRLGTDLAEKLRLLDRLQGRGYPCVDMSDNELAKLHVRHLVGGRAPGARDERLLRFEFPERPGALNRFLHKMALDWNITLFHYRNHGAAVGRVLVGIQVPEASHDDLGRFLEKLGYPHSDETANEAYRIFLS